MTHEYIYNPLGSCIVTVMIIMLSADVMYYGHGENPAEVVLKILLEFPVGGLM